MLKTPEVYRLAAVLAEVQGGAVDLGGPVSCTVSGI